jgi:hypothetical protein
MSVVSTAPPLGAVRPAPTTMLEGPPGIVHRETYFCATGRDARREERYCQRGRAPLRPRVHSARSGVLVKPSRFLGSGSLVVGGTAWGFPWRPRSSHPVPQAGPTIKSPLFHTDLVGIPRVDQQPPTATSELAGVSPTVDALTVNCFREKPRNSAICKSHTNTCTGWRPKCNRHS